MMNELRDRPIFICGHPKSGTTLLISLLDSHPQLVVYPEETYFFRYLIPDIGTASDEEKIALAQRSLLHFFSWETTQDQEVFQSYANMCLTMQRILQETGLRHDGDLLATAMLAFGKVHNLLSNQSRYWVEKTPYNEHFGKMIFNYWPEARCIHIVRDPRDNFATYHRKHPGLSAAEFSWRWKKSLRAGYLNQQQFGAHRYLIMRYEDLTNDPETKLKEIISFLGIEDHPTLRQPTNFGVPWGGNSMFNDTFSGISSKPSGRWKAELDADVVAVIETACKNQMPAVHYPTMGKHSLSAYLKIIDWQIKRTRWVPRQIAQIIKQRWQILTI